MFLPEDLVSQEYLHSDPFKSALQHMLAKSLTRFGSTFIAFGVAGSYAVGNADAHSDLDLVIIHSEPWSQRMHGLVCGVPVDIHIDDEPYFRKEIGRPGGWGLIATIAPVCDPEGVLASLKAAAIEAASRDETFAPSMADNFAPFEILRKLRRAREPFQWKTLSGILVQCCFSVALRKRSILLLGQLALFEQVKLADPELYSLGQKLMECISHDDVVAIGLAMSEHVLGRGVKTPFYGIDLRVERKN